MTDDTAKDVQGADDAVARAKAGMAIAPDDGSTPDGPNLDNPYAHIAETEFKGRTTARRDLVDRIVNDPRMHDHKEGFESCIQCGICTSGCPAARFTDYVPREVARRALEGDPTLLEDDSVWFCFYCYTCQSRCPRKNSVAVINQVVRSMQVESGYGVKHVEMFAAWGEQFYDKGMGGTPHVFFSAIAEAWGPKWKDFIANRDAMREEMGLGGMYPAEEAVKEVQTIMEETGFFDRVKSVGGWKDHEPEKRE
ncbi:MAG: 4Fe-4S dicluster domain-containing protein [Actinomycetes bacterium]